MAYANVDRVVLWQSCGHATVEMQGDASLEAKYCKRRPKGLQKPTYYTSYSCATGGTAEVLGHYQVRDLVMCAELVLCEILL